MRRANGLAVGVNVNSDRTCADTQHHLPRHRRRAARQGKGLRGDDKRQDRKTQGDMAQNGHDGSISRPPVHTQGPQPAPKRPAQTKQPRLRQQTGPNS